jgi:N-acetylmuramoyl-L-alanine amidase
LRPAAATLILLVLMLLPTVPHHAARDDAAVTISVDTSGPSTRLVLTVSRHVVSAVTTHDDRIEIVYAEPVTVSPERRELGDGILAGWRLRGDHTLILEFGPGFRHFESFELNNPSRLILDLQGSRDTGPATRRPDREREPKTIIVLDPGHGGIESGAQGPSGLLEKDVALTLATRLKSVLQQDRTVSVVLTRDDDRQLPLDERTAIANHNRADLFISIHLNASRRRDAYGAETYFLSAEATDDEARILAGLENRSSDFEDENGEASMPADAKKRGLDLVLWDLAQNQYLAESSALAEAVQRELNALAGTRDRGVRQAPFHVLMGATMPAILVEVGFISNPDEERRLMQRSYQDKIVEAMARAVREFQRSLERYAAPVRGAGTTDR